MKRAISLTLSLLTLLSLLGGCAPKTPAQPDRGDRTQLYQSAIQQARSAEENEVFPIETTLNDSNEYLLEMLGLTAEDMDAFAFSISAMIVQAYGIAAIYPAAGRADTVRAGLQSFIDQQKQNFDRYLADQYEIASSARLETLEDGTILLVMCQGQDAVFDSIRDAIQKG